jgi:ABC-type bacteriocin/lantibiotic exporter with double-glycine peptidase domain
MQNIIDTIATTAAKIEALTYPDAVILPGFKRSLQLDSYSCGTHAVFAILKYFRIRCTYSNVEKQLHTDKDGTNVSDINRVFRQYNLKCRRLRDLKSSINNGHPVLVTLYDSEHYAVVVGYSCSHIFVMNSSLDFTENGVGSIGCAIHKDRFKKIWD